MASVNSVMVPVDFRHSILLSALLRRLSKPLRRQSRTLGSKPTNEVEMVTVRPSKLVMVVRFPSPIPQEGPGQQANVRSAPIRPARVGRNELRAGDNGVSRVSRSG